MDQCMREVKSQACFTGTGTRRKLWISRVAIGNETAMSLRVYSTSGGLEWNQENPNILWFTCKGGPRQQISRALDGLSTEDMPATRILAGHLGGYLERFATL